MPPEIQSITNILSVLTVLTGLGTVMLAAFLLLGKIGAGSDISERTLAFFRKRALPLSFLIALGSMAASLFYSEIAGFAPCLLCWWQRIFLFPQVFMLAAALRKNDLHVRAYVLILSVIGGIISAYHTYITFGGSQFISCAGNGLTASCTQVYFLEYGYVTIPTMALTAFAALILLAIIPSSKGK